MAEQRIEVTAGEKGVQSVNITHDDGTVYDLSQHGGYTVTMYVRDDTEDTVGTNIADGEAVTIVSAATGACEWPFDFTGATWERLRGKWRCWLVSADGTRKLFTRRQPFIGNPNEEGAS